jgi:hypothetical protein
VIFAILLLAVSCLSNGWATVTRHLSHLGISKTFNLLRTRRLAVPKSTSAAVIVVGQLAQLSVKLGLEFLVREVGCLEPMREGFLGHLMVVKQDGRPAEGVLMDCCFNYPKQYATIRILIWGTAYLLFPLYYMKTGRVVE